MRFDWSYCVVSVYSVVRFERSRNDDSRTLLCLTNWLIFLCGQIQSPRPDVMPDRREGIARAEGFVAARIETSAS